MLSPFKAGFNSPFPARIPASVFNPQVLFASGVRGALLEFTASNLFQDATGRVPVGGTGDPVAFALDSSKGVSVPSLEQNLGDELVQVSSVAGAAIGGPSVTSYGIGGDVTEGGIYSVQFRVSGYDGAGSVGFRSANFGALSYVSGDGVYSFVFRALATSTLSVFTRGANTANFSDISVREVQAVGDDPLAGSTGLGENHYVGDWFTRTGNILQTTEIGATSTRKLGGGNPVLTREVTGLTIGSWYRFTADIGTSEDSCFFRISGTSGLTSDTRLSVSGVQDRERFEILWQAERASVFMGVVAATDAEGDYVSIDNGQLQEIPGNHAVQPVNHDRRPTYWTDGNVSWLELDGVDDGLFIDSRFGLSANPALTVIVALRHNNPGVGDARVWTLGENIAGAIGGSVGLDTSWRHNDGNRLFPGIAADTDAVVAWVREAGDTYGDQRVLVDGVELQAMGSSNPAGSPSNTVEQFSLSPVIGGNRFNGRIYSAAVFDRALSNDEIAQISKWMAAKQGRTL